jgi:hypothetical protein
MMTMDGEGTKRTPRNKLKPQPPALEMVKRRAPLSRDDHALYLTLVGELSDEKKPEGLRETALVQEIALNYVRLQRARRLETETLNKHIAEVQSRFPEPIDDGKALAIVFMEHGRNLETMQRKEVKIEDAWYRAMGELDREQAARRKAKPGEATPPVAADTKSTLIHFVKPKKS